MISEQSTQGEQPMEWQADSVENGKLEEESLEEEKSKEEKDKLMILDDIKKRRLNLRDVANGVCTFAFREMMLLIKYGTLFPKSEQEKSDPMITFVVQDPAGPRPYDVSRAAVAWFSRAYAPYLGPDKNPTRFKLTAGTPRAMTMLKEFFDTGCITNNCSAAAYYELAHVADLLDAAELTNLAFGAIWEAATKAKALTFDVQAMCKHWDAGTAVRDFTVALFVEFTNLPTLEMVWRKRGRGASFPKEFYQEVKRSLLEREKAGEAEEGGSFHLAGWFLDHTL